MKLSLVQGPGLWQGTQVVQVDLTQDPSTSTATVVCPAPTSPPSSGVNAQNNGQMYVWQQTPWTGLYAGPAPANFTLNAGQIYLVATTIDDPSIGLGVFLNVQDQGNGNYAFNTWSALSKDYTASGIVTISLNTGKGR